MRIFIIRHGDPYYPTDSLTDKGKREVQLLSQRLVKEKLDKIYISPLGRAQMTAAPTLETTGLEGTTLEWLSEFSLQLTNPYKTRYNPETRGAFNMPPLEWVNIENIYDPVKWREADIYKDTGIVERYDMICKEFDALLASHGFVKDGGLYRIKEGYEDSTETIALFCHLGLGNLLLSHISGLSLPAVWHTLFLPTSSVTTVFMERHREDLPIAHARLVSVGDTSHLFAAGEPISTCGLHTEELL